MLSLKNPNVNRSRKHTIALSVKSKLHNMFFTNIILIKEVFAQVRRLWEDVSYVILGIQRAETFSSHGTGYVA